MTGPGLTRADVEGTPRGVVLMLHGGREASLAPVDGRSTSWWRARWMMRHVSARANPAGVTVWLLRYRFRGWNGQALPPSPVADTRWALEEVRRELGPVPVVLLGHSMGARTAVAVADDPNVTGVVALAPWLPADEPVTPLAGKHLAAAHGRGDKITSFAQTAAFVRRAGVVAASTELTDMGHLGHYMLRHVPRWNRFAAGRSLDLLSAAPLGDPGQERPTQGR